MPEVPRKRVRRGLDDGPGRRPVRMYPLLELTMARLREFVREPEAIFWVFIFPVILALALGIAFRERPPETLRVGIEKGTPRAKQIMEAVKAHPYLEAVMVSRKEGDVILRTGEAAVVIGLVEGDTVSGNGPVYSFRFDLARPQSRTARLSAEDALQEALGRRDAARIREVLVTESGGRYIDFLIPGLIGLNLMASGMWGIGFNIVDARTRKLLKLFTAMPMRRSHFLLSFMLSRLVFLILEVIALVGFGRLVFGVRIHGSVASMGVVLMTGALCFGGLGLLVASRPRSIEAVSGWMNFVMLPMWLLSGSFFSYKRFPELMHPYIKLLPLTALNDSMRVIMNEGHSLFTQGPEMLVMVSWGLVSFMVALKIFRWQ